MATVSKNKFFTYRGGTFLLLALLIVSLICGFIIHHFSVVGQLAVSGHKDEGTLYIIIAVAIIATVIAVLLSVRLNRNIRNLSKIAEAMENGADIESMPDFANDELGDISRHITSEAMAEPPGEFMRTTTALVSLSRRAWRSCDAKVELKT